MEGIWYSTVERVKAALNYTETARNELQIREELESSSREIEGRFHRKFFPLQDTRHFNWPNFQYAPPYKLYLDDSEVIEVDEIRTGNIVIPPSDFFLEPANLGPPFKRIDLNIDTAATFGEGPTFQQDIQIIGLFGYTNVERTAGQLTITIDDTTTTIDGNSGAVQVGVGTIIRIENERMVVDAKRTLDTSQTLTSDVNDQKSTVSIPVTDASGFAIEEVIVVDAERMRIVDIIGNNLVVKRAWDGSVLASHLTNASVFAFRRLTVLRGALGTTAASHNSGTAIQRFIVPGAISSLCNSQTIVNLVNKIGAFGTIASGTGEQAIRTRLELINRQWDQAEMGFGRKARIRGI